MGENRTVSIAIFSGKGGVGKSSLALNICYALYQMGHNVLLMDCDMGLANLDVLLGVVPQNHIPDILTNGRNPSSVLVPVGRARRNRLDLLPANSGMAEFMELDADVCDMLRSRINPLASGYDFLCLDVGAGISPTVMNFCVMTAVRLVVVTPEPTSLINSYPVMKVLACRYNVRDFYILVNQIESPQEGEQTYARLAAACREFLGFSPVFFGEVRSDKEITTAACRQRPFMELSPGSPAALDCMGLANRLRGLREQLLLQGNLGAPLR